METLKIRVGLTVLIVLVLVAGAIVVLISVAPQSSPGHSESHDTQIDKEMPLLEPGPADEPLSDSELNHLEKEKLLTPEEHKELEGLQKNLRSPD